MMGASFVSRGGKLLDPLMMMTFARPLSGSMQLGRSGASGVPASTGGAASGTGGGLNTSRLLASLQRPMRAQLSNERHVALVHWFWNCSAFWGVPKLQSLGPRPEDTHTPP